MDEMERQAAYQRAVYEQNAVRTRLLAWDDYRAAMRAFDIRLTAIELMPLPLFWTEAWGPPKPPGIHWRRVTNRESKVEIVR